MLALKLMSRTSIKPLNYRLSLFNLQFGGDWSYDGRLVIDAEVSKSTTELTLNSKEINIKSAQLLDKSGKGQ